MCTMIDIRADMERGIIQNIGEYVIDRMGSQFNQTPNSYTIHQTGDSIEIEVYFSQAPTGDQLEWLINTFEIVETGAYHDENDTKNMDGEWILIFRVSEVELTDSNSVRQQIIDVADMLTGKQTHVSGLPTTDGNTVRLAFSNNISGNELEELHTQFDITNTEVRVFDGVNFVLFVRKENQY